VKLIHFVEQLQDSRTFASLQGRQMSISCQGQFPPPCHRRQSPLSTRRDHCHPHRHLRTATRASLTEDARKTVAEDRVADASTDTKLARLRIEMSTLAEKLAQQSEELVVLRALLSEVTG
jgi:hypothetical protein